MNEEVEKNTKIVLFGGWRKEKGRGGAILRFLIREADDRTRRKNRIFFSSRSGERRERIFFPFALKLLDAD